ncbi:imidazoleglycerol-phosphate dehydratase HisB [uncultured Adlercreutzia sp.]|uniref:imidazoleglycerol-phosphate dehydratase HisB n=1 Tax=uncultured Adlercreutzia sp. TaxID=875803 RepID=UPI002676C655|nr:imidazoleglycerol-phosphate dehydratase HisB [uncultured Adlercreutzia sp.]
MERTATVSRATAETDIEVTVNLDGSGRAEVSTGIGFFDHMLTAFARHGRIDLAVRVAGDLQVDGHHTVEDAGIVIGQALAEALGDKAGITRYGSAFVPMDEALVLAALDISGRGQLHWAVEVPFGMVGDFDTQLAREFFIALAANAGITLHVRQQAGDNVHHIFEAAFKAAGRALRQAVAIDAALAGEVPSTKGCL